MPHQVVRQRHYDLLNSTESIEELVTRIECDSKIDNDNVEFDEERAFAWLQRVSSVAQRNFMRIQRYRRRRRRRRRKTSGFSRPSRRQGSFCVASAHQIMSDVVGSVPLFRTSEEFEKSLKVWVLRVS